MARSNKIVVPDAKQSGSIGGNMVKRMITYAENNMNGNMMK